MGTSCMALPAGQACIVAALPLFLSILEFRELGAILEFLPHLPEGPYVPTPWHGRVLELVWRLQRRIPSRLRARREGTQLLESEGTAPWTAPKVQRPSARSGG